MINVKNENSYTENTKRRIINKTERDNSFVIDIYIQMILDEAILKRKLSKLEEEINHALETGNKELFMQYAKQYQELKKQELR